MLFCRLKQLPPQFVSPAGHIIMFIPQTPAAHTCPAAQTVPQAPQFITLV
jgi:hypothetical protein